MASERLTISEKMGLQKHNQAYYRAVKKRI